MIKYDYVIERVNENRIFTPKEIPKELPNLVLIEGPNSKGKSTLLNIIALSMYANKHDKINSALLNKMNNLLDSEHQRINFMLEISDKNNEIIFISKKSDYNTNEIILKEKIGKNDFDIITLESFENKYNLIYDIPSNPTERLKDLLSELKDEQNRYGNLLFGFHDYVYNLIGDISKYRDPERLAKLKQYLKNTEEIKKDIEEKLPYKEAFLDLFEKFVYTRFFIYYYTEKERLEEKIRKYNDYVATIDTKKKITVKKETGTERKVSDKLEEIADKYKKISPKLYNIISKSEKIHIDLWKNAEIFNIKDYEFDPSFKKALSYFIFYVGNNIEKLEMDENLKKGKIYETIFNLLKNYENEEIIIPKLKLSIKEFIDIIKEEKDRYEKICGKYFSYDILESDLKELERKIKELEEDLQTLKILKDEKPKIIEEIGAIQISEPEIKSLKNQFKEIFEKYIYYKNMCISKNLDVISILRNCTNEIMKFSIYSELEPFFSLNEKDMEEKITYLKEEIKELYNTKIQKDILIKEYEKDINELESKTPHKYENNKNELNILLNIVNVLSQRFLHDYSKILKNLNDKNCFVD